MMKENQLISIIVPAYNEEDVIELFYQRITDALKNFSIKIEIIFVNDGSQDRTLSILEMMQHKDIRIGIIDLSRNFGKEIAMTAGLDHADGDAVVLIDADLQDPPELIPKLIEEWRNGYDVVYAKRIIREGESHLKKITAHLFYRIMRRMGEVTIPEDTGDFRLLSRRAVQALREIRESHRFMKGLFAWIGYPQKAVLYKRDPRYAGNTKWNYFKLWKFAIDGITSFSEAPLKVATYLGLIVSLSAFLYGIVIVSKTLLYGNPVAGYPSLMTVILFFSGVQLISLGILGEYVGRMFSETKRRPLYFINRYTPPKVDLIQHRGN